MNDNKSEKLSVIIPCYNEALTIEDVISEVKKQPYRKEIIIVDDGSDDSTPNILKNIKSDEMNEIKVIRCHKNMGKGAAVCKAFNYLTGDTIIIQDADLEYSPSDYPVLLEPLLSGKADVVYGSRFLGTRRAIYFTNYIANLLFSFSMNLIYGSTLTDVATGFKAFKKYVLDEIQPLSAKDFSFEIEFTARILQRKFSIYEVPISYWGRTYEEGKKINWKHGLKIFWWICKTSSKKDSLPLGKENENFRSAMNYKKWLYNDNIKPSVGKRVMEIGSGTGNISRFMIGRETLILSDISDYYLRHLRAQFRETSKLRIIKYNVLDEPPDLVKKINIDTVVAVSVIEHVQDDLKALKNINKILINGGKAIIHVPLFETLYGSIDSSLGHFRRYSVKEIKEKMELCGFEVERLKSFNPLGIPLWFFLGKIMKAKYVPKSFSLLSEISSIFIKRVSQYLPDIGFELTVVGRKVKEVE
mgnify:CR=1 FL=1